MQPELQKRPGQKELVDKRSIIITIDGVTGSGKWALAEQLADHYNLTFLNTGISIRALALLAIEQRLVSTDETNAINIPPDLSERVLAMYDRMPEKLMIHKPLPGSHDARFLVGERDMLVALDAYDKRKAIENVASIIAATPEIRNRLYAQWRDAVDTFDGTVVVGRKTGEDLFPGAQLKVFLHADPEVSAAYRFKRRVMANDMVGTETTYVKRRDSDDRASGLLNPPLDAFVVDTSRYLSDRVGLQELARLVTAQFDGRYAIRP